MEKKALAAVAYYYTKKIQSGLESEKKRLNKNFSDLILEKLRERQSKINIAQLYIEYLHDNDGEVSHIDDFKEYMAEKEELEEDEVLENCPFIFKNENCVIDKETIQKVEIYLNGLDIETIQSSNASENIKTGIYHIDFGNQKMTAFIDGEDSVLFTLKLPEERDKVKYTLLPKEELIKVLSEESPSVQERLKTATKENILWEALKDILNGFTSKDILSIKKSEPTIVLRRGKAVDKDIALDNVKEIAPPFWKKVIEDFERDPSPEKIKAFSTKMFEIIKKSELIDSGFINIQKGRTSLENKDEYIKALENENLKLANKITKGDANKIKITIAKILKTRDLRHPDSILIELLDKKYKDKIKYRAQIKIEEKGDLGGVYPVEGIERLKIK